MATSVAPVAIASRRTQIINVAAVAGPFVAVAASVPLLWGSLVGWADLVFLVVLYSASMVGVTVGFHRLLTHRAFRTYPLVRNTLAVLGCTALQGPPITWVADHRQHHAYADEEGDPHSPHTHGGEGISAALVGLWHAHVGWLLKPKHTTQPMRYARDLMREPFMLTLSRSYLLVVLLSLLLPAVVGGLVGGDWKGALTGLVWGGFVRVLLVHHVTWSVNSLGHYVGSRPFKTDDRSTNVALLAIPSLGDAWHHNHHAFPTSARHGLDRWQLDLGGVLIGALERIGLAWDVVRVSETDLRVKRVA